MDSDSEVFLTQNTFRNENTENQSDGEEAALDFDAMFQSMSVSPVPKSPNGYQWYRTYLIMRCWLQL